MLFGFAICKINAEEHKRSKVSNLIYNYAIIAMLIYEYNIAVNQFYENKGNCKLTLKLISRTKLTTHRKKRKTTKIMCINPYQYLKSMCSVNSCMV